MTYRNRYILRITILLTAFLVGGSAMAQVTVRGSVYGGGNLATVGGSVTVNMGGGTVNKDVYGGGALANTNINNATNYGTVSESISSTSTNTTTVNLTGGLIKGDVYGGGLGQKTGFIDAQGNTAQSDIAAVVYGDISVNLGSNGGSTATAFHLSNYSGSHSNVVKSGRVFGCNNLLGSPQGNVTVTVYMTERSKDSGGNDIARTVITRNDKGEITSVSTPHKYDLAAVYGGGNLADYTSTGKKASVIIKTCEVSVHSVYGGGNAAAVPETDVLVNGAYEIEEVFGGGNGKDPYTTDGGTNNWEANPGADVNGNATTLLKGGYIHEAYGGSNSKGTISGNVSIDKSSGGDCTLTVEDLYGAGKDADIEGDLIMVMGCSQTRTENIYGCSMNANVKGNVELTITSGEYGRVFGGNNKSGAIFGHIIVNIEETGCSPIIIDELYGCGNDAPYSVYGYYQAKKYEETESGVTKLFLDAGMTIPLYTDNSNNLYKDAGKTIPLYIDNDDKLYIDEGKTKPLYMPRTSANDPNTIVTFEGKSHTVPDETTHQYDDPVVNIISCTRIGKVFGGGLGSNATVYGNPKVNINQIKGVWAGVPYGTGANAVTHPAKLGAIGGGYTANNQPVEGGVFGGGNEATVEGNTTVNIGTLTEVTVNSMTYDPETKQYTAGSANVQGAYITGNVYGGGNKADVTGNTYVNVCAVPDATYTTSDVIGYKGVTISGTDSEGVTIEGDVFGGGKGVTEDAGVTDAFKCAKAMVGVVDSNNGSIDIMHEVTGDGTSKGTRVSIGNGTIEGTVYGGGEIGRVEWNGVVTIGLPVGSGETSQPQITGNVFGGGKGVEQYGYAALLRGNTFVTVQANAKVGKSVYGGGEIASVGKYQVATAENVADEAFMAAHPGIEKGMPYSLANEKSGYCNVIVRGNAEIGPDNMQMTKTGGPDDDGHVFGAGKGILPYENEDDFRCQAENHNGAKHPGRMGPTDQWECYNGQEAKYLRFIETQALATHTEVFVGGDAFVKGSVYGGSLSGHVQHDTHVTIAGDCQIGVGYDTSTGEYQPKYTNWPTETQNITESLAECAHWTFDAASAPYDPYAQYQDPDDGKWYYDSNHTKYANGGSSVATDGHTYYGNVFGGGSGVVPYAAGKWHREAGTVGGNTVVDITGGHILTSVYGGNEHTDVGTYDPSTRALLAGTGKCTINMTGGTVGVPRTLADIAAHPVTCYVFGAGKGDSRTSFNEWTNVGETQVNISGNARIYGSTFGGGEDGHVLGDAETNIGGTVTIGGTGHDYPTTINDQNPGVIIGTQGLSGADGNIFGGGRGFSEDALTAGVVCGNVRVNIHNGKMLGSVFGGGRLASVGTHLAASNHANYGKLIPEGKNQVIGSTDVDATGATHGHITININGGTIGAIGTDGKLVASNYSVGDVFGGSKGARSDKRFGLAKYTTITMKAGQVNGNVYGGGELGNVNENTEVDIQGGTIAKNVFGGGKGADNLFTCEQAMVGEENMGVTITGSGDDPSDYTLLDGGTTVSITKGRVKGNVYGGGEIGRVERNTQVTIGAAGGTDIPIVEGSVFGAGAGLETHGYSALVRGTSTVTVQGSAQVWKNVYGGGEKASLGRYKVKISNGNPSDAPSDLPSGMPYGLKAGGTGFVIIQGNATIGTENDISTGHVYGAGQGIEPRNYDYLTQEQFEAISGNAGKVYNIDEHQPKRMIGNNTWEHFGSRSAYLQFLETLAISAATDVTIGGGTVRGSVFGGSESGFVYKNTDVKIQGGTVNGDAFGGGLGLESFAEAGRVRWNTNLAVSGGAVNGNVYGGGKLGDVGTIDKTDQSDYNYIWRNTDANGNNMDTDHNNVLGNNTIVGTTENPNKNTGISTVVISGGTIGIDNPSDATKHGNVFGAGQGSWHTWWCEKAIVYATDVSVSGGTVKGNVYGGGEVGRVEDDAKVTIGTSEETEANTPNITGGVFGGGAGLQTHGYSALVRGNSEVTVQGKSKVGGNVYGGGEIASVGRFKVDKGLPTKPKGGGTCTVIVKDNAVTGDVYGSCKGVTPVYVASGPNRSKSMQLYDNRPKNADGTYKEEHDGWEYYETYPEGYTGNKFIWRYYTEPEYLAFIPTLGLASNTHVTIGGSSTVNGSVFGGGQRGLTLGGVDVNITGGTVNQDVYGGGALANSNSSHWHNGERTEYVELDELYKGISLKGYYTKSGDTYTLITEGTASGVPTDKYYAIFNTNVNLKGGTINRNVYGGGLGQLAKDVVAGVHYTAEEAAAYNTEHSLNEGAEGYKTTDDWMVEPQDAATAIEAKVYGNISVELNKPTTPEDDTTYGDCEVKGSIFGCNNMNGSPQKDVTVHVYKTVKKDNSGNVSNKAKGTYEVTAVYGGGNLAAYYPDDETSRASAVTNVIIDGCDLTSIQTVYGGGNAAPVPASNITINATYEIEEVFGGGNGKDAIDDNTPNPGANVGYVTYPAEYDIPASSKDERTQLFSYGSGKASVTIYDGLIHRVFGGSNTKGNVRESAVTLLDDMSGCHFQIDEAYGGGKNAPMDAEAKLLMACIPGLKAAYGGAQEADVLGGVTLTITNGTYERVFGGNNISGTIQGPIVVNVEETGCKPIVIGELYAGGNLAGYSVYGYKTETRTVTETDPDTGSETTKNVEVLVPIENPNDSEALTGDDIYDAPQVNVKSFTSIGDIYGGGYGSSAKMVGNPMVNINVVKGKYAEIYNNSDNVIGDDARVVGSSWTTNTSDAGYANGYPIPPHEKGKIGAINNVFGGGNAAPVVGNPNVNIGTRMGEDEYIAVVEVSTTAVTEADGYYTRSGEGTAASPYTYTSFTGTPAANTTYYKKYTIKGADIRGNIYGGGNAAEVTGNTYVVIGKKATTPTTTPTP